MKPKLSLSLALLILLACSAKPKAEDTIELGLDSVATEITDSVSIEENSTATENTTAEPDSSTIENKQVSDSKIVYVTTTGDKYHTKDCRHAESAKGVKLSKARSDGKKACDVCKPNSDKDQKRCSAKTADGTQCKRMTANTSGKCYQHEK